MIARKLARKQQSRGTDADCKLAARQPGATRLPSRLHKQPLSQLALCDANYVRTYLNCKTLKRSIPKRKQCAAPINFLLFFFVVGGDFFIFISLRRRHQPGLTKLCRQSVGGARGITSPLTPRGAFISLRFIQISIQMKMLASGKMQSSAHRVLQD